MLNHTQRYGIGFALSLVYQISLELSKTASSVVAICL